MGLRCEPDRFFLFETQRDEITNFLLNKKKRRTEVSPLGTLLFGRYVEKTFFSRQLFYKFCKANFIDNRLIYNYSINFFILTIINNLKIKIVFDFDL